MYLLTQRSPWYCTIARTSPSPVSRHILDVSSYTVLYTDGLLHRCIFANFLLFLCYHLLFIPSLLISRLSVLRRCPTEPSPAAILHTSSPSAIYHASNTASSQRASGLSDTSSTSTYTPWHDQPPSLWAGNLVRASRHGRKSFLITPISCIPWGKTGLDSGPSHSPKSQFKMFLPLTCHRSTGSPPIKCIWAQPFTFGHITSSHRRGGERRPQWLFLVYNRRPSTPARDEHPLQ